MSSLYQTLSEIWSEPQMQEIHTELTTTISEFKKNPNLEVSKAEGKPFAVLTNNRPTFYVLTPELFDEVMECLWEKEMVPELLSRKSSSAKPVKVRLNRKG
jgi:antitoxin StbD